MATITTDTYLDSGTARTAGEAWVMNGATLTIRTDTRVHAGSPASMTGTINNVTVSTSLGGGVLLDGRNVREVWFDSGSGTVPAIGTTITQGGASGYLLGVWANLTSAPTTAGSAMPTSGFIKFREVTGIFNAGALTGITANATGADEASWIEIVERQIATNTIPRLGSFTARGVPYYLGVTTGVAGQIIQVPTNGGGAGTHVPAIQIETGVATGIYEWYTAVSSTYFLNANLGTDKRSMFVNTIGNGQLRIGNDGTTNCGYVPPAGCRIRVGNIFFRQCTLAAGDAVNLEPHATLNTRPDFITGLAGYVDLDWVTSDWYHYYSVAYKIVHTNCAIFDSVDIRSNAVPFIIDNCCTGVYTGTFSPLTINNSASGGIAKNSKFFKGVASSATSIPCTYSNDLFFENIHTGLINFARTSGTFGLETSYCNRVTIDGINLYNTDMRLYSTNVGRVYDVDYCDRIKGSTIATGDPLYSVRVTNMSNDVLVDGLTFGMNGTLAGFHNPYGAFFQVGTSSNVTFRNAGTRDNPLQSASQALSPEYVTSDLGSNTNVRFQRIYSNYSRTKTSSTNSSSTNLLFENVRSANNSFSVGASNTIARGCGGASVDVVGFNSVYGTSYHDVFTSDTRGYIYFSMNEPTSFNSSNVTLTLTGANGGFNSADAVLLPNAGDNLVIESSYFSIGHTGFAKASFISSGEFSAFKIYYDIDNGSGFTGTYKTLVKCKVRTALGSVGTNKVTVDNLGSDIPAIGDYVYTEAGTHFAANTTVIDVVGNTITLSSNILVQPNFINIWFAKDIYNEVMDPVQGVKLKIKIVAGAANSNKPLQGLGIPTTSTLADQTNNLYALDYATVTLTGYIAGTRIQIYNPSTGTEIYNGVPSGASLSISTPFEGDVTYRFRAMCYLGATAYIFDEFTETLTIAGISRSIAQKSDPVYISNGRDGATVTGITINDSALLINVDAGVLTLQDLYAYETYWLSTEEGIRDEQRIIDAVDNVNYTFRAFKIKNVSSPSTPLTITGGYMKDGVTGQAIDLIDSSGGTIFLAPDHVVMAPASSSSLTLAEIEASTVLAKEATSQSIKAKTDTIIASPTLAEIEASTVLAKQSTIADIAKIHGLVSGVDLIVTPTSRTAGDVVQSITEVGTTVTVARA